MQRVSCPALRAIVGFDYCLTDCRFVCRGSGACRAFADAAHALGPAGLKAETSRVKISSVAADALIHLNAAPTTPVNPPLTSQEHTMDASADTSKKPTKAAANKSRTAAATAARLAKLAARRAAAAAGQPVEPIRKAKATKQSVPQADRMMVFVETEAGSGLFKSVELSLAEFMAAAHAGRAVVTATDWRRW